MQQANRFIPRRGRAALLATACLITPIAARELPTAASAAQREIDQRRIDIEEAKELIERGAQAYEAKRYADAVTAFSGARDLIPESPVTNDLRTATTRRLVLASIEQARSQARKGDVEGAKATVDSVLVPSVAPDDPGALALRNQLDDPIRTNPALTKEHGADVDEVRQLLYTAEGAYNLGKFDEAKETYLKVLRVDATNTAARRGLEQISATKSQYHKASTDHARAELLSQVDAAWEMPPPPALMDPSAGDPGDPGLVDTTIIPMTNKLERIIIPTLILEDASLEDAIDLLRVRSAELDLIELDPARRGINFNLDIGADGSPIGDAIRAIRFDMRLSQVPIAKVLEYINQQTKTTYTTDDFSVTLRPSGIDSKDLITRTFRVPPNFLSSLGNADAAAADADPFGAKPGNGLLTERRGVLEMLKQQGIQFPEGATASLTGGSLVVINTPANLEIISQIVDSAIKTEPVMVCVRVTMIRTRQERLNELGFDWLLGNMGIGGGGWIPGTDILNFGGGTQGTGGNLGDMVLPPGQTSSPMTAGNRSGDEAVYRDSIDGLIEATNNNTRFNSYTRRGSGVFGVTKVLDNSSTMVLMRAISNKKGVDIMTAPSTVTRNGQQSSVRNVREMLYPQSYEPPELPNSVGDNGNDQFGGGLNIGGQTPMAITPSHPTDFTMREVGVILEVTPTADADNRFVDVALNPSVVEFEGFVNFGSPINEPSVSSGIGQINPLRSQAVEISSNRILMPVFSTHSIASSVHVADGATIVLGGLLQDRIQNVNDKVPVFGNIPLIGRLFESKVDQRTATAVIFLVNVKLVDPTGQPFSER